MATLAPPTAHADAAVARRVGRDPQSRPERPASVVAADDRPLVQAGVAAALASSQETSVVATGPLSEAVDLVQAHGADVLVVVLSAGQGAPLQTMAAAKQATGVRVLLLADGLTGMELREAVVSGVDGILLTTAPPADVARAAAAVSRGERVVSPEIAVHLVGSRRGEDGSGLLSSREMAVLPLLAEGMTNQRIAEQLQLSPRTVKTHVQNLLSKLGVSDRTGAVARGFRLGLIR